MATYEVTGPDGAQYEIEAASDAHAHEAMQHLMSQSQPSKLDEAISNVPKDAMDNLKALGAAATGPAMDIMSGNPAAALPGLISQGKQFMSDPVGNLQHMVEPITHPIDYGVQHPVSQALNLAGLASPLASGAVDTVGQYANRFGEDQAVKALGRVPPGMSADASRALGRRASEQYGLLDATEGPIGRKENVQAMQDQAGMEIGDMRDAAGSSMSPQEMADAIRERLKDVYSEGGHHFDDVNAMERQLQNIQQMPSSSSADFAQRATELNQNAKGKGFMLPHNVETDVAGAMSGINDENITKALPDEAERYGQLNQTFGDMKDIGNIIERGEKRSVNSRGSNTLFEAGNKFIDEIGAHKLGAKVGMGIGDALQGANTSAIPSAALMGRLTTNPQSFGQYAQPLLKAMQEGGSEGFAATHFLLASQFPEYNEMTTHGNQE